MYFFDSSSFFRYLDDVYYAHVKQMYPARTKKEAFISWRYEGLFFIDDQRSEHLRLVVLLVVFNRALATRTSWTSVITTRTSVVTTWTTIVVAAVVLTKWTTVSATWTALWLNISLWLLEKSLA